MNYIWLVVVAGGALVLGLVLAFGMFKQRPRRTIGAVVAALAIACGAVGLGFYIKSSPTVPTRPPDRQHSEDKLPAAAGHSGDLPGRS